jgi:hypothetical protein
MPTHESLGAGRTQPIEALFEEQRADTSECWMILSDLDSAQLVRIELSGYGGAASVDLRMPHALGGEVHVGAGDSNPAFLAIAR